MFLASLLLAAPQGAVDRSPFRFRQPSPRKPNVVLILADDMGVDYVGAYGEAPNPPCTPNIDSLAGGGMLFRNAWAHPTCVPARAALLTGRHGFRTGLGVPGANGDLALAETIVPEMLTGYASACFGKWHLAGNNNNAHPNQSGFLDYAGPIGGFVDDYQNWPKITNGAPSTSTNYLTRETADDAISWLQSAPEPFFLFLSFNAPHAPWHIPPPASCSGASPAGCAETYCGNLPMPSTVPDRTKAMTEAMDVASPLTRSAEALRASRAPNAPDNDPLSDSSMATSGMQAGSTTGTLPGTSQRVTATTRSSPPNQVVPAAAPPGQPSPAAYDTCTSWAS